MKYYSLLIGGEFSKRKNWMLLDLKIPAMSVKEALLIYYISLDYRQKKKDIFYSEDKLNYIGPNYWTIERDIHRVIEYEKIYTPRKGYTQHQYKKIRYYSKYVIMDMYKHTKSV